jgi:hypothetical protein
MRKFVLPLAAILALGLSVKFVAAADDKDSDSKGQKITGVLVDDHCADKFKNEKAAAKHPASCAAKCTKDGGEFVLFQGDKKYKLDQKGNELAKDYIAKKDAKTKVTITGQKEGDEIKVTDIMAAPTGD